MTSKGIIVKNEMKNSFFFLSEWGSGGILKCYHWILWILGVCNVRARVALVRALIWFVLYPFALLIFFLKFPEKISMSSLPQCISPVSLFLVLRVSSATWIFSEKNNTSMGSTKLDLKHASIFTKNSCSLTYWGGCEEIVHTPWVWGKNSLISLFLANFLSNFIIQHPVAPQ